MPSQPFSASCRQNSPVTAASVAIIWRTNWVVHSPSRNLRAVSRSNSCSSLNPISIPLSRSGTARSDRHRTSDDAAVHDAPVLTHRGIDHNAMQQTAVVPHDQITRAPAMDVDELRLRDMREQLVEQRPPLCLGEAEDMRRMIAEIERLSAG